MPILPPIGDSGTSNHQSNSIHAHAFAEMTGTSFNNSHSHMSTASHRSKMVHKTLHGSKSRTLKLTSMAKAEFEEIDE